MCIRDRLVGVPVLDLPAGDNVGVHIHRVHRVGHQHGVVHVEQIHNVAHVALGAVAHKHLRGVHVHAEVLVVVGNGLPQEGVAVAVRGVAVEGLLVGLLLGGVVHGLDDRRGQGHGHVANAHLDDLVVRVLLGVGGHLFGNGDKQVALLQILEIAVQLHLQFRSFP